MIRFLTNRELDREKWDNAIKTSCYETAYGYSWYLDLAADNWDALVEGDYEAVMPLPWKKKYFFNYIYQPLNCQQLGIFATDPPAKDRIGAFLDKIPSTFHLVNMNMNSSNMQVSRILKVTKNTNCFIYLNESYEILSSRYHTNTKRNLSRTDKTRCRFGPVSTDEFIRLKSGNSTGRHDTAKYERLRNIIDQVTGREYGMIEGAWIDDELCAAVFWIFSETRLIYLLSESSELGKENRAMFMIVDELIRKKQKSNKVLDFEGSNIPSIARFFEGFGASPEEYYSLSIYRSGLLKLLKGIR